MSPLVSGQAGAGGVVIKLFSPGGKPLGTDRQVIKGYLIKRLVGFNRYPCSAKRTDMNSRHYHRLPPFLEVNLLRRGFDKPPLG